MITALPPVAVDLRAKDARSPLKERSMQLGATYAGYEELLPYMTQCAYDLWMKQQEIQ